jgi:formylglycine-generating enzyme required for sulfatase activity
VWSVPASSIQEVWRRKTEFAFQLVRQAWPAHFPVVNFELGLKPEEARTRELRDWPRPDWVPWTVQLTATPAGSPRMTRSWALILGMDTALPPTFEPRAAYEDRLFHGLLQLDVSVAFERSTVAVGDNWYGATWLSPTSLESQELHEVDPDRHLAEAKRLTSDGYRPVALAVATGPDGAVAASVWHRPADVSEQLAVAPERTLRIAAALHHLGDKEVLWNLCRRSPDSTARFLLADRASDLGLSASELVEHLGHEEDPGVCQVLLLALGSYPAQDIRGSGIARIANQLERLETRTLDPGVHSAASWLRGRLERDGLLEPHRELNVDPPGSEGRLWTVDGQGHTLAVIAGPVEFVMGESRYYPADPDGVEARHRVRVPRSFALQTSEVSVGDFQAFLAATEGPSLSSTLRSRLYPDQPDVPVTGVGLLDIARYANWLSELEGVPRDQWCFVPDGNALRLAPDYLDRVGHRLPTEAEWEYVCRAGTTTARPFGRGLAKPDPLTARYAWHLMNATGRVHPVAHLWPNDLGLFDVLGNAREFCLNTQRAYCKGRCSQPELDVEEPGLALDRVLLVTRGGSVETPETGHFSSHRNACDSLNVPRDVGFRLARTIRRP